MNAAGPPGSSGGLALQSVDLRAQLAVLVAQLPVRFDDLVEPPADPPRPQQRGDGDQQGGRDERSAG